MYFKASLLIPSGSFRTDTKFNDLLTLGEGLRAHTARRVSGRLHIHQFVLFSFFDTSLLHIKLALFCFRSLLGGS